MSDTLIKVEGLSKKFCTSLKRSMLYGTYDAVRDSMIYGKIEHFDRFLISSGGSILFFLITWRLFYISEEKVIEKMI